MKVRGLLFSATVGAAALVTHLPSARAEGLYSVSREVSNVFKTDLAPAFSRYVDADLDMPWGLIQAHDPCYLFTSLACHAGAPPLHGGATQGAQVEARKLLWAANHDSRVITVYNDLGVAPTNGGQALTITVAGAPTGLVYNAGCEPTLQATWSGVRYTTSCDVVSTTPTHNFDVGAGGAFAPSFVMAAARDGKIYGWNPGIDVENAQVVRDDSATGADYLGLAQDPSGSAVYLADFHNGRVVAYDRSWNPVSFVGREGVAHPWLEDSSIPQGFAPSNLAFVNGRLIVTYGKQGPAGAAYEAVGPSFPGAFYSGPHGYAVAFTLHADGTYEIKHLDVPDRALDAPWGIVVAPAGFGEAGPRLCLGNFGDGYINVFDAVTLDYGGRLGDLPGAGSTVASQVRLPGLRGLQIKPMRSQGGVGAGGFLVDRLFYNANLNYRAGAGADAWSVFGFIAAN